MGVINLLSGGTIDQVIKRYPTPQTIAEDGNGGWIRKDGVTGNTVYYGFAILGADDGAPIWKIRREVTTGNILSITYADGDVNFDNVWDDRATLNYS